MKLANWLDVTDVIGLKAVVWYEGDDEEPLWQGSLYDIPYWIAKMKLASFNEGESPISFRDSLGKEFNDKAGVVITVTD